MKKLLAAFAALLLAGSLAMGAACTNNEPVQPSDQTPSGTGGEIVIPVPDESPISPVPATSFWATAVVAVVLSYASL